MITSLGLLLVWILATVAIDNTNPDLPVVFVTFKVPQEATASQGLYWAGVPGERISDEKPYFGNSDAGTWIHEYILFVAQSPHVSPFILSITSSQSTW